MPQCMECTNSTQERRTRYPPPLASAKSRTTLSNTGLCLGHSHSLRDQTSPAVLLLPALQQQVTLDFKYFIHFLIPTYLNISIYWVKPGRLPPGGSALASGKYQLEKNTSSRKTLGCISSTFPPVYCTPDTHTRRVQQRAITKTMVFSNSCLTWAGTGHGQPESAPLPWVAPRGDSLALPRHVVMVKELLGGPQLTLVARGSHTL